MNNGKVRIYELAKELGKENKDILEICALHNIAVKSHSSTITELQAEQIRVTAQKSTPNQQSASKTNLNNLETGGNGSSMVKSTEGAKNSGKLEILAVHHKHRSTEPETSNSSKQQSEPVLMQPPRPPVKPNLASSQAGKPTAKNSNLSETVNNVTPPQKQSKEETVKQTELEAITVELDQDPESSQLLNPPPIRPKKENPQVKTGDHKPILKPVKKGESPSSSQPKPTIGKKPANVTEEKPNRQQSAKKPTEEVVKQLAPKLQQRPTRPKSPQEIKPVVDGVNLQETEEELIPDEEILIDLPEKSKLSKVTKKLTPPRAAIKQKSWEEEEEKENKAKLTKTTKNKRRGQIVIEEEDEEIESVLQNMATPNIVSLSIVRPPKPKSNTTSTAEAPAVASKAKKPTPKSDNTPSRTENRETRKDKKESAERPETVVISGNMTVRELSELLMLPETDIIKNLFFKGIAVNITQSLDVETATLVATELGVKVEKPTETSSATKGSGMISAADLENLHRRPPVVTIMGHVDHGKTTLLDSIRKTKVAQGEAGGITQHIGAYHVDVEHEGKQQQIVFLDTPGHEAFTAMRARGARVTDIAILVVAADDGVQPQTKEAISHAQAAEVPIVVAINKIDKPDANPDRVKQELAELGLLAEEWGGDTIMVPVSALKGENLDNLLEMILLVAEVEELTANPDRMARGTVIEANLDRTRGPVATLLVQNGSLKVGDILLVGSVFGKIRAMIDDRGNKVESATPSFAVEVLGLNDVPAAGDEFEVFESEKEARLLAEQKAQELRQTRIQQRMSSRRVTLTSFSEQAREGQLKELNLILKADVQGSVEAIYNALQQLPQNEVQLRILLSAAGEITETDVDLAAASGAVIIGFNTTLASGARSAADSEGVDIREYNIIYKLLDDIQGAMEGLLDPEEVEEPLGTAEVRAVFTIGRGAVAGCYVLSGKLVRNRQMRVRRKGEVIFEGILDSLKRIKDDAKEVNAGYECGIGSPKFNDWQEGDIIESYQMIMKRRTLSLN